MEERWRVSRGIAQQLKEAGYDQSCDAYWRIPKNNFMSDIDKNKRAKLVDHIAESHDFSFYAAFCCGRLMEDLPCSIKEDSLQIHKNYEWEVLYGLYGEFVDSEKWLPSIFMEDEKLADALGLVLLELHKCGLVKW